MSFQIVVCGTVVPDPLQTLEPVTGPGGPALKSEMMLPAVLDPWAGHALYEAAHLAAQHAGSKVWLVSLGPKAKLQQVMMTVAQKVPFELVPLDGPASGFKQPAHKRHATCPARPARSFHHRARKRGSRDRQAISVRLPREPRAA